MFCFDFDYDVETWKNDQCSVFRVSRSSGRNPFTLSLLDQRQRDGHGTIISAGYNLPDDFLSPKQISELIGSKFATDPSFEVYLNRQLIELSSLKGIIEKKSITINSYGQVTIYLLESESTGRVSSHHGVAWHVNRRLVGTPSWKNLEVGKYLDARSSQGKKYTFVVEADILADQVIFDWTWFEESEKTNAVVMVVDEHITRMIQELFQDVRKEKKREALKTSRENLNGLPRSSRAFVGKFVDEILLNSPTMKTKDLLATVEVLAKMEESRNGYKLLGLLAKLPAHDIDRLSELLEKWSIDQIRAVLEEIDRRIELIRQLENVVRSKSDELHEIQPLFDNGLWIFGPEYEGIGFRSNKTLTTIVRDGIAKVLILELKKGGSIITTDEIRQAEDYAKAIVRSNAIKSGAEITCFVLGTYLAEDIESEGTKNFNGRKVNIYPRLYETVLEQANARTFYLKAEIEKYGQSSIVDEDVEQVVNEPQQSPLFGDELISK